MSNKVMQAEHLTVNYDQTSVLWDINFSVPASQIVGILGPNGAGKSTLLKTAMGLVKPLSGKVLFWDKPIKDVYKSIAYVPQRNTVDWDFPITVFDVVLMGRYGNLRFLKRPRLADKEAVWQALEQVGLSDFANRQICQLSGGQQQKIFLARALVQDADVFLLDEPFRGVDMSTQGLMIDIMEGLARDGKTLFVVHHDLNTVEVFFSWLILLNTCLVASGPTKEVFSKDNLIKLYGKNYLLLDEATKLSCEKNYGLK